MIKPTKLILLGIATAALILLPRRSSPKNINSKNTDSSKSDKQTSADTSKNHTS